MIDISTLSIEALWIHFETYGNHAAGIEICDRANCGDLVALNYAKKIWG